MPSPPATRHSPLTKPQRRRLREEFAAFFAAARAPRFRSMGEFAQAEIIAPPGGPRPGLPINFDDQPWPRLWFAEVDSERFVYHALVAMVQGGKTLAGWVIPAMYYLFERQENVGCGIPQMEMAWDKWSRDLLPVIRASRYAHLIPTTGLGSKGGKFESITFTNGVTLKFLSARGSDAKRSGITFRILVMTEVDKYDEAGESSRETNPVAQMIARLESHPMLNTRVFLECTPSFTTGKIWREYTGGTESRIVLQCPYCAAWGTLEREHLRGWQEAADEVAARELAHFVCPNCEHSWTEAERVSIHRTAKLVHRGQEVTPEGDIVGPVPRTYTLGFRASMANNCFKPAADIGWKEWRARHQPDEVETEEGNNEKALLQFQWAKPWGGETAGTGINPEIVASRLSGLPPGVLPWNTETLVAKIDVHQKWHVWTLCAGVPTLLGHPPAYTIIDYGLSLNPDPRGPDGPDHAVRRGLELLCAELEDRPYETEEGQIYKPGLDLGLIDSGSFSSIVLEVANARGGVWRLDKGQGKDDKRVKLDEHKYQQPKQPRTADVRDGDHWFDSRQPAVDESDNKRWWLVIADTNHWMGKLHAGFMKTPWLTDESGIVLVDKQTQQPIRRPGSIALFGRCENDDQRANSEAVHFRNLDEGITKSNFATQVCGWIYKSEKTKQKGEQIGWYPQWASHDHFGDTGYGCLVGDSVVRAYAPRFRPKPPPPKVADLNAGFRTPDGRPYLVTDR